MDMQYFEIISRYPGIGVMGVCTDEGVDEEMLGDTVGLISKKDFDLFSKRPWTKPKSKQRFEVIRGDITLKKVDIWVDVVRKGR